MTCHPHDGHGKKIFQNTGRPQLAQPKMKKRIIKQKDEDKDTKRKKRGKISYGYGVKAEYRMTNKQSLNNLLSA